MSRWKLHAAWSSPAGSPSPPRRSRSSSGRGSERTHTQHGLPPSFVNTVQSRPGRSDDPVTWYIAADYCNWLSEQEGLPKDQWCYLPNEAGAYAEGMSIPADVLAAHGLPPAHRGGMGIRLPLRYGDQLLLRSARSSLLDKYAWYQANSKEHAWSCGSLLPNDLGLFDMLGNEFEWCKIAFVIRCRKGEDY